MSLSPWPTLVTLLALMLYFVFVINVGRARAKYNIPAPQVTGNEDFERVMRVQQNTMEQLIFFLPVLWIFSITVSTIWGAALGLVWVLGRAIFAWGYYQAAEKRTPGFAIGSLSGMVLFIGGLVGVIRTLL